MEVLVIRSNGLRCWSVWPCLWLNPPYSLYYASTAINCIVQYEYVCCVPIFCICLARCANLR